MPKLKSGRPHKYFDEDINLARFHATLRYIQGDPDTGLLKTRWTDFSNTYFETTHSRIQHAKKCYYLYKKHKNTLTSGNVIPVCDINNGDGRGSKKRSDTDVNMTNDSTDY